MKTYKIYVKFGERLSSMTFIKKFKSFSQMYKFIKSLGVECIYEEV